MRRFIAYASVSLFTFVALLVPAASVFATDPFSGIDCSGAAASSAVCSDKAKTSDPITGPNGAIRKISLLIARITGIAAVIMIVVGGFMYVTSSGDASKANDARRVIIYALVGLVVIVLAQSIILFVLNKIT
ncbi:MAG TPA: hypothetical protein VMR45_04120 [Patescibacteria group bacterium]|jgi:hypothetical protein|nr:hypothetical protein [Patescibacteria group bacterium]